MTAPAIKAHCKVKRRHATPGAARVALEEMKLSRSVSKRLRVYRCDYCGGWHLGRRNNRKQRAAKAREGWFPMTAPERKALEAAHAAFFSGNDMTVRTWNEKAMFAACRAYAAALTPAPTVPREPSEDEGIRKALDPLLDMKVIEDPLDWSREYAELFAAIKAWAAVDFPASPKIREARETP